jgi:hypothetical protein
MSEVKQEGDFKIKSKKKSPKKLSGEKNQPRGTYQGCNT